MKVVFISALLFGGIAAYLVPSDWVWLLVLPPFLACITLGWFIIFQNKAIQVRPFRLFFWPLINITAPMRQSKALYALLAAAAFAAGSCFGLLLQVQGLVQFKGGALDALPRMYWVMPSNVPASGRSAG
jgi:hypothetical protein